MDKMQYLSPENKVQGRYTEGFQSVVDAFSANLAEGEEFGAACAIYQRGKLVVDIWGGVSDTASAEPWLSNTIVPVHSVTKGVAAVCVLHLVDQGLLELDAPVATYWPEFAAHGKQAVTVRDLLGHRAGVPFVDGELTIADIQNPQLMAARLAAQRPAFEPGSSHTYHALTIGWLTSELVRRVTGESIGVWLAQHIAKPLSLDMFIGLPESERYRVARIEVATPEQLMDWPKMVPPDSFGWKVYTLNGLLQIVPGSGGLDFNDFSLQSAEFAGAGMLADARSLAKFYSACIWDMGMPRLLTPATIADASKPLSVGVPFDTEFPGPSWGTGVMIPWSVQPMLGPSSFGHDGYGGSLAFADPENEIAFAYVRNRIVAGGVKDPTVYKVVDAVHQLV